MFEFPTVSSGVTSSSCLPFPFRTDSGFVYGGCLRPFLVDVRQSAPRYCERETGSDCRLFSICLSSLTDRAAFGKQGDDLPDITFDNGYNIRDMYLSSTRDLTPVLSPPSFSLALRTSNGEVFTSHTCALGRYGR
ncbi:unnamed protein product [Soboliphyme baturini]|uniref:Uncharacterized protein n=1 Tax=Soboliphyme baturini TaxID=241478 RepID=A0A183IR74_9BILA|nr:unnamed protein product [Soboliphyme baturini]